MANIPSKSDYITIGNKKIRIRNEELDIFELDYYPQNPRIDYILSKTGSGIDQNTIEENLWKLDSTKDLSNDIRKNGGLIEEILVIGRQVIEGNTRLCAYRHLLREAPEEQKDRWRKIKSKVILDEISTQELFSLLGTLHIKGKTEWDPFEKASYMDKMLSENGIDIKEVAQIVGMGSSAIKIQIKAYEMMRDEYLPRLSTLDGEKADLKKFSIFEEYFKSAELQSLARESPQTLSNQKFVSWVLEGRIRSAAYDVKKDLAGILRSKNARKEFLNSLPEDAVPAAKRTLNADRPETNDSFLSKLCKITRFLKDAKIMEIKEKISDNPRMVDIVKKFHSEVNKFYRDLEIDNPNKEFIQKIRKKQ